MIDRTTLLADCQRLLRKLEDDIRDETNATADRVAALRAEHQKLKEEGRTAASFGSWLDEQVTQSAASWILACVFVRYMEDNGLLPEPFLAGLAQAGGAAGATSRLQQAQERRSAYFSKHPADSDREYLQHVFRDVARIPACKDLFAEDRNPLWRLPVSGDGGVALVAFWHQTDPDSGALRRDFVAQDIADTRFLGDLYQDLSEDAKKRFALLQTPEFVEEFILDYTLEPAIETFGLEPVKLIDPTCGSGHFLLGAFKRLLAKWEKAAPPGLRPEDLARKALHAVHGVDINPFAAAIARFRLLVAALVACGRKQIRDVPAYELNVAVGDSLLLGVERRTGGESLSDGETSMLRPDWLTEGEYKEANRILGGRYHAVVGNPPYITCKDAAVRENVRSLYASCHGKYALTVPFIERFFDLTIEAKESVQAGYLGMIAGNNFIKREFGKKLIEEYLASRDVTHVIDSSGALRFIPGHSTPTIILFARNRIHASNSVRAVMGIRGEPERPLDLSMGKVWRAIVDQLDQVGSKSEWVSVADLPRTSLASHPWSLQGGGATDLQSKIEAVNALTLKSIANEIGVFGMTNADEVMLASAADFHRCRVEDVAFRELLVGDELRDWVPKPTTYSLFPYSDLGVLLDISDLEGLGKWLWPSREVLYARATFGGSTYRSEHLPWWKWHQIASQRLRIPRTITFAFVATHNHFIFDRGGKVFKQTAPVIKLLPEATEDDHLWLMGLLNSSTFAFWGRQVLYPKNAGSPEQWEDRLEHDSTKVGKFPIVDTLRPAVTDLARRIDGLAIELRGLAPIERCKASVPTKVSLADDQATSECHRDLMIAIQEELDWLVYEAYGLLKPEDCPRWPFDALDRLPPLQLGQRAFEIVLARRLAAGEEETEWFSRHGSTPITDLPAAWPAEYRALVERRIKLIEEHPYIRLLERPEHKRRWQREPWDEQVRKALYAWLCDRLEDRRYWSETAALVSCHQLADKLRQDGEFLQVAQLYRGTDNFDLAALVHELVENEAVPYLPALRYTDSGLRKRKEWEEVWDLQREEDRLEAQRKDLREKLDARAHALKRQHHAKLDDEVTALKSDLEKKRHAFHERFQADKEYEPADLLTEFPADAQYVLERSNLVNLHEELERKESDLQSKVSALARRDSDYKKLEAELEKVPPNPEIPVPPRYKSNDFRGNVFWRHRGKLDVPKERFVSYPGAEREADHSMVVTWAGYDHLQQATALAAYYVRMKENEGWPKEKLAPLLAGLDQLVPWLKQWHNELHPTFNERMGDYYATFVQDEARSLGKTLEELRA